jgi:hypothetical protein
MTAIDRSSTRSKTETMMASYSFPGAGIDRIPLECPGECADRPSRPRRELIALLPISRPNASGESGRIEPQ